MKSPNMTSIITCFEDLVFTSYLLSIMISSNNTQTGGTDRNTGMFLQCERLNPSWINRFIVLPLRPCTLCQLSDTVNSILTLVSKVPVRYLELPVSHLLFYGGLKTKLVFRVELIFRLFTKVNSLHVLVKVNESKGKSCTED